MSCVTGRLGIGIPLVLLYESEGLTVSIETTKGELYRGILIQAEDNMNCFMRNVTRTDSKGKETKLETCYIRGKSVLFIAMPDFLSHSPIFKRVVKFKQSKGRFIPQGTVLEGLGNNGPSFQGGGYRGGRG